MTDTVFLNILNLLKVPYSQDCNQEFKGKGGLISKETLHRREYEDLDYYAYDEPAIVKRKGLEAKRSKRDSEDAEYSYEDQEYLPAEHRELSHTQAQNRQSSNPM